MLPAIPGPGQWGGNSLHTLPLKERAMTVLDDIPFELDPDALLRRVHVAADSEDAAAFGDMLRRAVARARPKALYRECYIDAKGERTVTIGGVTFTSAVLRANLDQAERVFAYLATCGREVDETDVPDGDLLAQFWLDTIKGALLGIAVSHLASHLETRHALGKTATMAPGSGDITVWPIEQQRELFSLLGDTRELIGVELTDSFLMVPNKSLSGIRFPTEVDFRSCQLCRRENCPSRSAEFDPQLWQSVRDDGHVA